MKQYQYIERSTALAVNDVDTLQNIAKRQLIELKKLAREADSLLVSSVIRNACIQIDTSIAESLDNARKLLK